MVCYLHLQANPVPGNALLLIKPIMMLVCLDFVNVFPQLQLLRDQLFKRAESADLGPNFLALNMDSYYWTINTTGMLVVFVPVFILMLLLTLSSIAMKFCRHHCLPEDWYILLKTVVFMQFGLASLVMLDHLFDTGYQTALSLLFLVLLGAIVPIYTLIRAILLRRLPGRQLTSVIQRAGTLCALVLLNKRPTLQVITLYGLQLAALALHYPPFQFTRPT